MSASDESPAATVWRDLQLVAEEQRHEWQLNWIAEEYERRKRIEEGAERLLQEPDSPARPPAFP